MHVGFINHDSFYHGYGLVFVVMSTKLHKKMLLIFRFIRDTVLPKPTGNNLLPVEFGEYNLKHIVSQFKKLSSVARNDF